MSAHPSENESTFLTCLSRVTIGIPSANAWAMRPGDDDLLAGGRPVDQR
jgi:hypothetical protein